MITLLEKILARELEKMERYRDDTNPQLVAMYHEAKGAADMVEAVLAGLRGNRVILRIWAGE